MLPLPHTNMGQPEPNGDHWHAPAGTKNEFEFEVPAEPYYFDDLRSFGWSSLAGFITLAGGAYPIVLGAVGLFYMLLSEGTRSDVRDLIVTAPMFALFAGFVGIVWSAMVAVVTLPVLHLILWSMKLRIDLVKLGAFAGGLVGFLAVLPWAVPVSAEMVSGNKSDLPLAMALGPGLATILGQLGGARGGLRAQWRVAATMASRRALARIGRLRPRRIGDFRDNEDTDKSEDGIDVPRFRFRIIHLLWLSVWLSLLLAAIRLSGIPYELVLPLLLVWTIYQWATLIVGGWLLPRIAAAWQARRQIRST